MSSAQSKRAIFAALLANLGIAVFKFVAFAFTRSSSMLAEGVHSLADTGNQVLLIVGAKRAGRPPDADHPFGFGRERYFFAFVVSIVLFSLGSLFALFEGVHKVLNPERIESPAWAIGTLLVAAVLEAGSFRTAVTESNRVRGTSSWRRFIQRSKSPELPIVLLEDLGALCGLAVALGAITMGLVTGDPRWDGYGTITIGLLLAVIATTLSIEMKSLLIGESADEEEEARITEAIESSAAVRGMIHLRTQHLGPEQLLVSAKVEFDDTLTVSELAHAIDEVEAAVRANVPAAHFLFIEPDVRHE